jgi:tetratricopeptide (TPR) repeat protein
VARAGSDYEKERYDATLECSEEALDLEPRLVAALHYRAAALAALGRMDEARIAYSRALAVDPDDPETLWSAADLYVEKLGGEREALELGREYALRGIRFALRPPHRDRDLAARLALLAAMAENDLGRSRDALGHLEQVLADRPDDPDALYERGVALYELCRFAESERALSRVLQKSPDDAWAIHYRGLLAERAGDEARAQVLFKKALELAPSDFKPEVAADRRAFDAEIKRAVAALPVAEQRALREVPIQVEDLPAMADLTATDPPLSPSILGLFRGPPENEPCDPGEGPRCRAIVFYRKNLARFARDQQELTEQVKVTLLHELGHLHGEDDEHLRERGLE